MKIGELAERSGLAASAIRYYEEVGLLVPAERRANGYRVYAEAALDRLQLIQIAQNLGFSLEVIRSVTAKEGDAFRADLMRSVDTRLAEIEKMMRTLSEQRDYLLDIKHKAPQSWARGECMNSRDLPDLPHKPDAEA